MRSAAHHQYFFLWGDKCNQIAVVKSYQKRLHDIEFISIWNQMRRKSVLRKWLRKWSNGLIFCMVKVSLLTSMCLICSSIKSDGVCRWINCYSTDTFTKSIAETVISRLTTLKMHIEVLYVFDIVITSINCQSKHIHRTYTEFIFIWQLFNHS